MVATCTLVISKSQLLRGSSSLTPAPVGIYTAAPCQTSFSISLCDPTVGPNVCACRSDPMG